MIESEEAVLPVLKKIQNDVSNGFCETNAKFKRIDGHLMRIDTKLNIVVDAVAELQDDVSKIQKDNLIHLNLTTRHHLEFEELWDEVKTLSSRLAVLEARS